MSKELQLAVKQPPITYNVYVHLLICFTGTIYYTNIGQLSSSKWALVSLSQQGAPLQSSEAAAAGEANTFQHGLTSRQILKSTWKLIKLYASVNLAVPKWHPSVFLTCTDAEDHESALPTSPLHTTVPNMLVPNVPGIFQGPKQYRGPRLHLYATPEGIGSTIYTVPAAENQAIIDLMRHLGLVVDNSTQVGGSMSCGLLLGAYCWLESWQTHCIL